MLSSAHGVKFAYRLLRMPAFAMQRVQDDAQGMLLGSQIMWNTKVSQ